MRSLSNHRPPPPRPLTKGSAYRFSEESARDAGDPDSERAAMRAHTTEARQLALLPTLPAWPTWGIHGTVCAKSW